MGICNGILKYWYFYVNLLKWILVVYKDLEFFDVYCDLSYCDKDIDINGWESI